MTNNITMRQMLEAGVHFGHRVRYWNPKMAPYIFSTKSKVHIINLEKTLPMYKEAVNFLGSVAAKKGRILFVGTKQQARNVISEEAKRCGMPYVDYRWLGGMLTNYKTIRQSLKRLEDLEELRDGPKFPQLSKKEALSITREITKLERGLGGIRDMGGLPDAIFVLDVGYEKIAVTEARKLRIPIVGVVDTNNVPDEIDYVIPGNDDSIRAIKLYLKGIVDAVIDARSTIIEEEKIAAAKADQDKKKLSKKLEVPKKRVLKKKVVNAEKGSESDVSKPEDKKDEDESKKKPKVKTKAKSAADKPTKDAATVVVKKKKVVKAKDEVKKVDTDKS